MSGDLRPTGRPNARLFQTVRDMVISLAVVLGVIGVVLLLTLRPQPDPVRVVDPTPVVVQARAEADYPVLYPADLDAGWRPTSARWQVSELTSPEPAFHVGYVTPDGDYVQLGQSATLSEGYVESQTGAGQPVDSPVGSLGEWQRYEGADGTRSLVRIDGGVTTIVSGTAPWEVLMELTERLSPTGLPRQ
ncbi:MAG: DUF4245 domain-containing protein [Actinomycetota bacterium]